MGEGFTDRTERRKEKIEKKVGSSIAEVVRVLKGGMK